MSDNTPEDPHRVAEAQASYREDFDPAAASVRALNRLKKADFTPEQAESVVLAVRELAGDLVTKSELRIAIAELRTELRTEMAELKSELKIEIKDSIHKSILWVAGINLGVVAIATAVIIAFMQHLSAG